MEVSASDGASRWALAPAPWQVEAYAGGGVPRPAEAAQAAAHPGGIGGAGSGAPRGLSGGGRRRTPAG